jgi:hypothetical protein
MASGFDDLDIFEASFLQAVGYELRGAFYVFLVLRERADTGNSQKGD